MAKYTKEDRKDNIKHIKQYMEYKDVTKDLRLCCERCEEYMGDEHDFGECENCPILELWYEVKWWRNRGSWEGCHDMNY